jgi:hypothetical protein
MNRIISKACRMIADGKSLKDVSAFLDPVNQLPSRHPHCVVREAWTAAQHQARIRRAPPPPAPPKGEKLPIEARRREYRGERRNKIFARPNVGNAKRQPRRTQEEPTSDQLSGANPRCVIVDELV